MKTEEKDNIISIFKRLSTLLHYLKWARIQRPSHSKSLLHCSNPVPSCSSNPVPSCSRLHDHRPRKQTTFYSTCDVFKRTCEVPHRLQKQRRKRRQPGGHLVQLGKRAQIGITTTFKLEIGCLATPSPQLRGFCHGESMARQQR